MSHCTLSCVTVINDNTGETNIFYRKEIPATTGWLYDSDIARNCGLLPMLSIRYHFDMKPVTDTGTKMTVSRFFIIWKKLITALQKIVLYHPKDSAAFLLDTSNERTKTRIPIDFVPNTKEGILNIYRQFFKKEPSEDEQQGTDNINELHTKSFNTRKLLASVETGLKNMSEQTGIYGKIAKSEIVAPGAEESAFIIRIDFSSAAGNYLSPIGEFVFDFQKNVADEVPMEMFASQIPVVFSMFFDKTAKIDGVTNRTIKTPID